MSILTGLLIIIEVVCSLLLIGLIMIQKSRSEGLGLAFGAGMGETLFGSRAGNILTKLTIAFGIVFLANTLFLALVYANPQQKSLMARERGTAAAQAPMTSPTAPGQPPPGVAPTLPAGAIPVTVPSPDAATPAPGGIPVVPAEIPIAPVTTPAEPAIPVAVPPVAEPVAVPAETPAETPAEPEAPAQPAP
jgi:preprotein translocase subunit SecG